MGLENLFEQGIEYFNSGYFFEAHDTFEEIWMDERGEGVKFYQGLVQLSTGFYHLTMGNLNGAKSQLRKGIEKLNQYKPSYRGLELTDLLDRVKVCVTLLENNEQSHPYKGLEAKIPLMVEAKRER